MPVEVAEEGNRRRGDMSVAEVKQCILDIKTWFRGQGVEMDGIPVAQLEGMSKELDLEFPVAFEELYQEANGTIWFYEYQALAAEQIGKVAADVNDAPSSKLIPFARDLNDDLLVIDTAAGEAVFEYSDGVGKKVAPTFLAFCEKFRNDLLSGHFEFTEEGGVCEKMASAARAPSGGK